MSPQTLNGTSYEFTSWSDGGAATHEVRTPATNTTYTATYRPVSVQTQDAYPGNETTRGFKVGEWKNSLLQVRDGLKLRQVGFSGGAGQRWELRRSTNVGGWGAAVASGMLGTANVSNFFVDDIAPLYVAPGYYTFHVWVAQGSYSYGTVAKTYPEFSFLSSSTGTTNVTASPGTYQLRFVFAP